MNFSTARAAAIATLTIALVAATSVSAAFAFPDPGEPGSPGAVRQTAAPHNVASTSGVGLLERIGTEFVRGDDLTGAGVPAPHWVPEDQWSPITGRLHAMGAQIPK
ncbi:hypothetical protein [Homoserinimonas sp. OAct 916]|uniref:hypothetical protein n=1 Tax=Homoserinimonas sp. OAct 916 TaxID=2211450 RepID=UPI0013008EF5|nr:hypothetical protein [Homoserinimonas sp. OAct 916]